MLHVLIRGVDSERMRRRMFETDKLDLEKAVQMCQVMESTTVDLQQMGTRLEPQPGLSKPVEAQEGVAAVNSRRPSGSIGEKRRKDWPGAKPFSGSPHSCSRCGRSHKPRQCPAYGQKCLNCQGLNHFARMCNKAKQQSAHLVGDWADPESPTAERGEVLLITVERVGKKLLARVQFHIEGRVKMVTCQLDTAASCNVMSRADYNKLGCPKLTTSNVVLTMYDGTVKKTLGRCCVQVANRVGEVTTLRFELLETSHHSLLSLQTCLDLKLLSYEVESVCLVEAHNKLTKDQIVADYPDVFRGLGLFPGEYTIELDTSIPPVQNRPRRIPHTMKQAVESKLAEMEKAGIIARVDTPTDWISNKLEQHWLTKNWVHRLFATLIGVVATDCYFASKLLYPHQMSELPFLQYIDKLAFQLINNELYSGRCTRSSTGSEASSIIRPAIHTLKPIHTLPEYSKKQNEKRRMSTENCEPYNYRARRRCVVCGTRLHPIVTPVMCLPVVQF